MLASFITSGHRHVPARCPPLPGRRCCSGASARHKAPRPCVQGGRQRHCRRVPIETATAASSRPMARRTSSQLQGLRPP
jgi:hypothetical protein